MRKEEELQRRLQGSVVAHLPCKVVGIASTIDAGKGTIAKCLTQNHGYSHLSVLRKCISEERGRPEGLSSNTSVASCLQHASRSATVVEKMIKKAFICEKNCVIEPIRATGEAALP
eukprot:COSAG02_NODE_1671_length_11389_cov_24.192826_2_plen_116_part_00